MFRAWREGTFKTSHSGRVELSYFEGRVAIERETVDVEALAEGRRVMCGWAGDLIARHWLKTLNPSPGN